jgi:hypothetical protein
MPRKEETPYCFGKLENVFPMGNDGLRHTPESCTVCLYKTECLRRAVQASGGLKIKEEQVDRAYTAGTMSFFERWSRKKDLHRRMEKKKKKVK